MELDSLWLMMFSALLGGYVFVFGFLGKVNEWYYVVRFGRNRQYPLPPGDMGWPVFGNLFTFLRAFKSPDPDSFISNIVSIYGRTGLYKSYLFGRPCVIVCSPETCKIVMAKEQSFKVSYPKSTAILMGRRGFHNITNTEHKRLRGTINSPLKGQDALSMYIPSIERHAVDNLHRWSSSGRPITLTTEFLKMTFKIINTIFMGSDAESDDQDVSHLYGELMIGLKSLVINLPGFAFHRALKARKKLVKSLGKVLEDKKERLIRSEGDEKKKDMIDLLMKVKDEEGNELDDENIVDLLLVFMMAAHESTAHAATWIIINLTQNPHFLAKAKEEQEEIMKRRPSSQKGLNLQEIKQMSYLSKVIDEMLRKTSPNFANFREAKVDVHVKGYTIPKGWQVLVWNRAVHMDPETYQNPKKFDPERWDNEHKVGCFMPFGFGSRMCPGIDLTKLELSIFFHHFLLFYKVELLNPEAPLSFLPMPRPSDNCPARVIKINT